MGGSGTCNVCSAPCTTCMHVNRVVSGLKSEGSSVAIFVQKGCQHSASDSGILNPVLRRSSYHQDSVSMSSSHESVSENIENIGMDVESYRKDWKGKFDTDISNQGMCLGGSSSPSLVCAKLELSELVPVSQSIGGNPLVSGSELLVKPIVKIEAKTDKNLSYLPDESSDCSNAFKGTLNCSVDLPEVQEPSLQCQSGDESEEVVEHDVNICDICGDAGREDLLATCSGCSDGAEHTYCMQEKMEKIPGGEWFCEDCRLAERMRKQRDMVEVDSKVPPYSRPRLLQQNHSLKMDSGELRNEGNRENSFTVGAQSCKRQLEKVDSSAALKRQATEVAKDLPISSSSRKLSRDGSCKNIVHEKVTESLHRPSQGNVTVKDRTQTHKGPLLKSNSFSAVNPKSKDKFMDDIHNKQKAFREPGDSKEGANRLVARSLSLKPTHLGRVNAVEPKVKMLSPKSSHTPYPEGFKKPKEQVEKKKAFREERTLGSSSSVAPVLESDQKSRSFENDLISSDVNSRSVRVSQVDGKVITSAKVTASRRASDIPGGAEKKIHKPNAKVETSSGTRTAVFNEELISPRETLNQIQNNADHSLTRVRTGNIIYGSTLCHRCKEPSTAAHVCLINSPRLAAADAPASKVSSDDADKGNQLKAAIQAALLRRPGICKKSKLLEHEDVDEEPVSTSNMNSELAVTGLSTNPVKNTYLAEKKHMVTSAAQNLNFASGQETSISYVKQPLFLASENIFSGGRTSAIGDRKPNMKLLPTHPLGPLFAAPVSAIPVHEYIWQGDFEVNRNGEKVPDLHHGFQAHLSTLASPKVFEVVPKFSSKLSLVEVPRLGAWPPQFHESGVTEDNIALYFFAKGVESYEGNYKNLLDNMMRNDIALKGNIEGVELLIFSSSQLPQKSQRWNMLFFLWGVFRVKKADCVNQISRVSRKPVSPEKSCIFASGTTSCVSEQLPPMAAMKSEQQDCNFGGHSISSLHSSAESSPRRSSPSSREEHNVYTDCKVQPKPSLFAPVTATASESMPNEKCLLVHVDSATDGCGTFDIQKLYSVGLKGTCFVRNEKESFVAKTISEDELSLKKELFMKNIATKELRNGQLHDRKRSHIDLMESFSPISPSDFSGTLLSATTDTSDKISKKLKASVEENDIVGISASQFQDVSPSVAGKKILYDLNLDASDLFGESGATEGHLFSIECPQSVNLNGGNCTQWDLNSSAADAVVDGNSKDYQDQGVPVLNLALGKDTESPILMNDVGIAKEEAAPSASLSLSLAFPLMDEKQKSIKAAARTEQLHHGPSQMKPPFLLFGGLAEK